MPTRISVVRSPAPWLYRLVAIALLPINAPTMIVGSAPGRGRQATKGGMRSPGMPTRLRGASDLTTEVADRTIRAVQAIALVTIAIAALPAFASPGGVVISGFQLRGAAGRQRRVRRDPQRRFRQRLHCRLALAGLRQRHRERERSRAGGRTRRASRPGSTTCSPTVLPAAIRAASRGTRPTPPASPISRRAVSRASSSLGANLVGGPSLVDHADSTVNFEQIGRTPYLYYTRFNDCCLDRDLVRVLMTFTRHD